MCRNADARAASIKTGQSLGARLGLAEPRGKALVSAPLSVIHVLRAPVGGLFRHVRDLATAQAAAGHTVGVVADALTSDRLTEDRLTALKPMLALGLVRFPMSRVPGPADARVAFDLSRHLKRCGARIVHGHGAKGGAYARLAARMMGRGHRPRTFYTPHGGSLHFCPTSLMGRLYGGLERQLAPWTDALIFESRFAAEVFRQRIGATGRPHRVVPNGLAPADFELAEREPGAADVLFVGELRELKGVSVLLDALARLRGQGLALTARLVGDGPDRARFEAETRERGLAEAVTMPGAFPARVAFRQGRILAVPSLAESFPYIVLEGLAAGLPLVATSVGGIPEMVEGLDHPLVAAGDASALADRLRTVYLDLANGGCETLERSRRARAHVEARFSVQAMAAAIEQTYRDVPCH
jgi:glycosyltransferase involved in cell wall biosynthesis